MLPFFTAVVFFTACTGNPKKDAELVTAVPVTAAADTSGLAQFQAWKTHHELAKPDEYNMQATAIIPAKKAVRTITPTHKTTNNPPATTQSGSMSSESANTAKAPQKKGWSKAAKGAAIGAGTGAVIGAVVNKKNRVAGGVIGGAAGGAVGYGIGRHIDKRDGRY